ncbi:hypothetical protein Bhyg_14850 [Pseudolycoriella hygida]|uniref:Uncharacterized protein n=1 Tax=Pseudolycoriella hygida TaxID=35572 RepID=A0A9Q0MTV1_9DIPT|nr:hypothetical protein Bhyg_14850 [Pseudolycoriella hygida]
MLLPTVTFFVLILRVSSDMELERLMRQQLESIHCPSASDETIEVNIQSRNQLFRLSDLSDGSIKIDFERIPYDHVLLTFTNDRSNKEATVKEIDCWSTANLSMTVPNALGDETQTFCLMEKDAKTVSPLDCLSILPRNGAQDSGSDLVWLMEDDKALVVSLLVVGLIVCLVFGFGIGTLIVRRQVNARKYAKRRTESRPDLITSDWRDGHPYAESDTMSVVSDRSNYVPAPSQFDLIKMRLEKAENPNESENQYGLEDMPYSKAPTAPAESFRDSGISTCGPIYAISSKVVDRNEQALKTGEDLYLCVDHDIDSNNKKNE